MSFLTDIKNISTSDREVRRFGYLVGGIAFGIGLLLMYLGRASGPWWILFGGILVSLGFISPRVLRPVYKVWMTFGIVAGFFVTNIILTLFFYIIFTSIAFLLRATGKQFLDLTFHGHRESYWRPRANSLSSREDLERQF